MDEIAPGVYLSSVYPGINVGLVVTGRWVVAVDAPPFSSDHQAWRKAARAIGRPIRYLILTDDHPDRLLGALWVGVPIIAGRGTWQRIRERGEFGVQALVEEWNRCHASQGKLIPLPDLERIPLPELVVDGRVTLEDEVSVSVESVPGPSAGSVWVWLPQRAVLFTGDGALHGPPSLSESPSPTRWLEVLTRLEEGTPPARIVVPGRGPVGGPEIVRPLTNYLRYAHQRLQAALFRGKSPDLTVVAEELLQLFPPSERERERLLPQIRTGLERWLEEMKSGDAGGESLMRNRGKMDEMDRIRTVKAAHEAELMRKANVVGVGIGLRQRGGKYTGELVLVVSVTHKVPLDELDPGDVIPQQIDGVPVDVQAVGTLRALGAPGS